MTDAPQAQRATRPGWRDPRLWVGVALVTGSVVAGAGLLGGDDDTVEVWAARHGLAAGQKLTLAGLVPRQVAFVDDAASSAYLRVDDGLPDHATLARSVGAGELVPAGALGDPPDGLLEVPLSAPEVAVPDSVAPGSVVDVWVTPDGSGDSDRAELVLRDVVVVAVPRAADSFGPTGDRQVVVAVDPDDASGIGLALAAARDDRVAITVQG